VQSRLTKVALLTLVNLIALIPGSLLAEQTSASCSENTLPAPLSALLKSRFAAWRPKQISDLDSYDQQLWRKAHPKQCPGIAVGHFERVDQIAYAILLVPKEKSAGGYKIVVFDPSPSGDGYTSKLLDHAVSEAAPQLVIATVPPGKHSDFEDAKSITTRQDSVLVDWIEGAAVLYYWSGGRYRTLQAAD